MLPLLRALRPAQWVKNVFVLAPLVFALRLAEPTALARGLLAFLAFCCAASAIYLYNDLRDRHEDRRHPLKRHRPIASGELGVATAIVAAVVLTLAAGGLALFLGGRFGAILGGYLAINLAYSSGLKHLVILDLLVVAVGYVLRVLAGSAAIGVRTSAWLLLCTIFLALFLILAKRRHELVLLADKAAGHRAVLSHYSAPFLDQMINVVTASTVVSYALYAVDDETVARFGTDRLVFTMPMVLFGVFRFLYLVYQRNDPRNPTEAVLTDLPSLVNLLVWGATVLGMLYGVGPLPQPAGP